MSLTRQDVENIAWLARLEIDESEMTALVDELAGILTFVERLDAAPVSDVEPMAHPLQMTQRLRSDIVTGTDDRERLQRDAPATDGGLYLVPRVID